MRPYATNSPQAAGRIVAIALLADGHLCKAEIDVLDRLEIHRQLGLARSELHAVVHGFCEDLLATAQGGWADACRVDTATLYGLLAEVDEPALRRQVLELCVAVVDGDGHLADGESMLLAAAMTHWGLSHEDRRAPAAT
ncbi:MAG: TerB family tellurite resistance protein [Burkholderiaceae bacterium]|nr:TerB family tellurite resistance protein [Burkholderiaceae bacterium]